MCPEVSVIMSVYNGEKYLEEAIDSILNQTFNDFELVIVDDGSFDQTAAIIKNYKDPRIKYFYQKNRGASHGRNRCIKESKGEYIACMDSDDISVPERIEKQVYFLEKHPDIGIVGSWATKITEDGESMLTMEMPQDDFSIRKLLKTDSPFFHSSVMFRRCLFNSCCNYPVDFSQGEDWILWHQFSRKTIMANIEEALIKHRIHPATATNYTKNEARKIKGIVHRYIENRNIMPEDIGFFRLLKCKQNTKMRESNYWFECGSLFLMVKKDHLKARSMLKKGLMINPFNMRGLLNIFFTFFPPKVVTSCKTYWRKINPLKKGNSTSDCFKVS